MGVRPRIGRDGDEAIVLEAKADRAAHDFAAIARLREADAADPTAHVIADEHEFIDGSTRCQQSEMACEHLASDLGGAIARVHHAR